MSHRLCDEFDFIGIEDLNLDGMKRRVGNRSRWSRKVSDLGFAEFIGVLEWVALKRGCTVRRVERFFASTKTCSACGHKQELGLEDRSWTCGSCGVEHDRDVNAALNIQDRALSLWRGDSKTSVEAVAA